MKEFIKKLLDESTPYSTQRVLLLSTIILMFIIVITNIVLCFMTANLIYISALTELCLGILGIATAGKVIQRSIENKEVK